MRTVIHIGAREVVRCPAVDGGEAGIRTAMDRVRRVVGAVGESKVGLVESRVDWSLDACRRRLLQLMILQ